MIRPGQVNAGLKKIRRIQKVDPISIYNAGRKGYPKALYGRSASGLFLRKINRPAMVST